MRQRSSSPFHVGRGRLAPVVILSALAVGSAVMSLRGSAGVRIANPPFKPRVVIHVSHADETGASGSSESLASVSPQDVERQQITGTLNPMPPTRGSFMAVWANVNGAGGYRLDVSTDASFASHVSGYQDLDVGNVTSRIVAGLKPANRYYYRVRAYDSSGSSTSANSDVATPGHQRDPKQPQPNSKHKKSKILSF